MYEVNAILALNEKFRFIKVQFANSVKTYTYKTIDDSIEVGDKVLVDSPSQGMVVVTVAEVCKANEVDLNEQRFKYKWIVQKIDLLAYETLCRAEEAVEQRVAKAKIAKTQVRLQDELRQLMSDEEIAETVRLVRL